MMKKEHMNRNCICVKLEAIMRSVWKDEGRKMNSTTPAPR
jgi:hypothetical protein